MMKSTVWTVLVYLMVTGMASAQNGHEDSLIRVESGVYMPFYSSSDDSTRVDAFLLEKYPVTNAGYLEFVKANPEWRRSRVKSVFADERYLKHWAGDLDLGPKTEQIRNSPVTNVSWFAARAYARWKGMRLPTLDEWEYVASASRYEPLAGRDSSFIKQILDWYSRPNPETLPPVGQGEPNFHGIYDMHGLIWEWVEDFNTVFITGESRNDQGELKLFYCAAGSKGAVDKENYAAFLRFAFRGGLKAAYTVNNLGFRCAKDIE